MIAASPAPQRTLPPPPPLPTKPLHATYTVEVNKKGQVTRVAHGNLSGTEAFDTMTLGNAMQMWIRKPDGSAIAGTYSVRYDYDPHTKKLTRTPTLISEGGSWANAPGAADLIVKDMERQAKIALAKLKAQQKQEQAERAKHLPDINAAVRRAVHPSASPKP